MENGGDWLFMTIKSQTSQVQWNKKTGKIRVRNSKKVKWIEGDKPVKAMFALQIGINMLEELEEKRLR